MAVPEEAILKDAALGPREPSKPTGAQKLGIYYLITLPLGIFLNIGCVVLLLLLWFGDPANDIWQRIVLGGWASRCVVILSLVIRTSAAGHAVLCVSMLAAIVLERFETPLFRVPAMSVMRFQNSGATDLRFFLFLLRRKQTIWLSALAALIFIDTLSLQFTSTILLSDFGPRNITVAQSASQIAYALDYNSVSVRADEMDDRSILGAYPDYPTFIEYAQPAVGLPDGLSDTGTSIRGFLPFTKASERNFLAAYSGMATLFDTRVVCARPSSSLSKLELAFSSSTARLSGNVDIQYQISRFSGTTGVTVDCPLVFPGYPIAGISEQEWPLSLCSLSTRGGLVSSVQEYPVVKLDDPSLVQLPLSEAYLVINATGSADDWFSAVPYNYNVSLTPAWSNGDWLGFEAEDWQSVGISISLCYSVRSAQYKEVDVVREHPISQEPAASCNNYLQQFDTSGIRQQLGATLDVTSLAQQPSSLFRFREAPTSESLIVYTSNGTYIGGGIDLTAGRMYGETLFLTSNDPNTLLVLCNRCGYIFIDNTIYPHAIHSVVFNDIVRDMGSPLLALQALITSRYSQFYYANGYLFSINTTATTSVVEAAVAPVQSLFLCLVMAAVAVEIGLVLIVTLVFIRNTQHSTLGNSWQAISHVTGSSIDGWLCESNSLTDKEVKTSMKSAGVASRYVGLDEGSDPWGTSKRRVIRPQQDYAT